MGLSFKGICKKLTGCCGSKTKDSVTESATKQAETDKAKEKSKTA